ncbi:MAG: hypothetical protein NE334_17010 [Lentisphaeraceae bacterium]|nr:hypothetical protein [Lentisphaeraceae bacterium]
MKVIVNFLFLTIFYIVSTGCAGLPNDKDEITTIIVTSNNFESRPLAEFLQIRNNQPIIELPGNKADTKLYVKGPDKQLMVIDDNKFANFINFSNPMHVIVLGNDTYVSKRYIKQINPNIKTYIFDDEDWRVIAWQVEELTGYSGLADDYIELLDELVRSNTVKGYTAPSAPSEPKLIVPAQ